ncbi:MAG: helix-turn-helix domain-containing protein [Coriobacteriales bacterium]|nr:helix-turn-helix domain-containing protein [Coriobacteriales bacterium]
MKLNADVIFDNLPTAWNARLLGDPQKALQLRRPELFETTMREFRDDHLYILREERLPQRVRVDPRAVIVCLGPGRRTRYFAERCCVIQIPDVDFYVAFNTIQRTFDRYDAWEEALDTIIEADASIPEMLSQSGDVFGNPLSVIDAQFSFLGQWARDDASDLTTLAGLDAGTILNPEAFASYIAERDLSMDVSEPFVLDLLGTRTLNANLIDSGAYQGCLTVYRERREFRASDIQLAGYLATKLVQAIRRRSTLPGSDGTSLKRILMNLVDEVPLDGKEQAMLDARDADQSFVCVRIRLSHRLSQLPIGYVCTMVESAFPGSIAFEHHRTSVVSFVNLAGLQDEHGSYHDELLRRLRPFVTSLQAKAAISDPVSNLARARLFFLQASTTLENGSLIDPDESIYEFQHYALTSMIVNALGDMPIDMLFSEGLRRLAAHDESSQTSYLSTLRMLLDHNMSVTKTARALFVHRSTLLERLSRIERILGEDLSDPDVRLRLQIVLKALTIREAL